MTHLSLGQIEKWMEKVQVRANEAYAMYEKEKQIQLCMQEIKETKKALEPVKDIRKHDILVQEIDHLLDVLFHQEEEEETIIEQFKQILTLILNYTTKVTIEKEKALEFQVALETVRETLTQAKNIYMETTTVRKTYSAKKVNEEYQKVIEKAKKEKEQVHELYCAIVAHFPATKMDLYFLSKACAFENTYKGGPKSWCYGS